MAMDTQNMKAARRSHRKPLSRKAKLIGLGIGSLLGWQVLFVSLAAGHGDQATDLSAADSASTSQIAATMAAEQRLNGNDPAGARIFARQALAISPVSATALRDLGFAEQGLGHWQQSNALLSQAAALGWRDGPTQLWLAQAYLEAKDYRHSAERLDAVLRTAPLSTALFDIMDQVIADKALDGAMVERLELNPIWRSRYLQYIGTGTSAVSKAMLLTDLSHSKTPPSRDEILPVVSRLVQTGDVEQAKNLWFAVQHASGTLYDPGFEHVMTTGASPFEWGQFAVLGANARTEPQRDSNAMMFSVTTDGSAAGILLRQLLTLPPGEHILDYRGIIPANTRQAFGWKIRCFKGGTLLDTIGTSSPPYRFSVPKDCQLQYIELHVTSSPSAAGSKVTFNRLNLR
jgi:hypothetical protein